MSFQEKLISEIRKLGDVSDKDTNAAVQIYLELCEVKRYHDVEYKYNDQLKQLYFTAKRRKSEGASVFVPRCSTDDLSFNTLQDFFQLSSSVFLALVSSDSTCVFYQISDGLEKPAESSAKHLKLNKQEKLDTAVRKNRNLLTEAALCGIPVTIRESSQKPV